MIDVRALEFTYPKAVNKTLKGLDFSIEKREIVGFLGPSGAGKSTTQKIVIGVLKRYGGSVKVLGTEVSQLKRSFYEDIGVSFELPNLYGKLSAKENLDFFSTLYAKKTHSSSSLLEMVGLLEYQNTRVQEFSKGMKMRLNFCRSLLNKPSLLFLDEPTSGLDPLNARNIKDIILEQRKKGTTVFLTTHNMAVAEELCDRVAFLVDGAIALIDSPRNLKVNRSKKQLAVEYLKEGTLQSALFPLEGLKNQQLFLDILEKDALVTMHTQEASLEDIFIQVTGRSLT